MLDWLIDWVGGGWDLTCELCQLCRPRPRSGQVLNWSRIMEELLLQECCHIGFGTDSGRNLVNSTTRNWQMGWYLDWWYFHRFCQLIFRFHGHDREHLCYYALSGLSFHVILEAQSASSERQASFSEAMEHNWTWLSLEHFTNRNADTNKCIQTLLSAGIGSWI